MKFTEKELVFMMLAVQQRYGDLMLECAEEGNSNLWWKHVEDRDLIIKKINTLLNEQVEEEEPPVDRFSY